MIWFTTDIEMKVKEISGLKGYTAFTSFIRAERPGANMYMQR
jgi:hypothetical protein